jgi:hypothetical protein
MRAKISAWRNASDGVHVKRRDADGDGADWRATSRYAAAATAIDVTESARA